MLMIHNTKNVFFGSRSNPLETMEKQRTDVAQLTESKHSSLQVYSNLQKITPETFELIFAEKLQKCARLHGHEFWTSVGIKNNQLFLRVCQ